jgi:Transposase IS4/DDE_Tnp_1-like zinc-ribbon
MGLIQLPSIEDYWRKDCYSTVPFFGKAMTRNRFQQLYSSMLHACNDEPLEDGPLEHDPLEHDPLEHDPSEHDPLEATNPRGKIQPFLDKLVANFQKYFIPGRELALDNSLIGFKGRLSCKVYKPVKWGVLACTLADSNTGYVYNINIHYGKKAEDILEPEGSLTKKTESVMDLLEPLLGMGYHVCCDRLFNSCALARALFEKRTHLTGTLFLNRTGVSSAIKMCKLDKNETAAFRKSHTLVHMWNYESQVNMISTSCEAKMIAIDLGNGVTIEKPAAVDFYNKCMCAVDLHDQLNEYYSCGDRKSVQWWQKVFFWLLEVSVVNAYVLCRESLPEEQKGRTNLKSYRKELIKQLVGNLEENFKPKSDRDFLNVKIPHLLGKNSSRRCLLCSRKKIRKETVYYCATCPSRPFLHIPECFNEYHEALMKM